jgi:TAG lipase/steryl ester hydrolase/phospholipase A2/LPA acyltransferase
VIQPDISTKKGVRWFEPLTKQVFHFIRKGYLMDAEFFNKAVYAYFGDWTFEEAYKKTKRSVNIVLTISNRSPGTTTLASASPETNLLLMNHTTSPNVLIRSCVHASCALPGLMEPVELLAKDRDGNIVPYMPGGVRFVDGSLKADIPVKRLSELFNATQFIVSQVNPHVTPFLIKREKHEGILSRLEYFSILELKSAVRKLAKLKLIPRIFGEDVTAIVLQKYRGDINIYPKLTMVDNFNVIRHPEKEDMVRYIRDGMQSAFPQLWAVQTNMYIEKLLDEIFRKLEVGMQRRERKKLLRKSKSTPRLKQELLCDECRTKIRWYDTHFESVDADGDSEEDLSVSLSHLSERKGSEFDISPPQLQSRKHRASSLV